MEVIEPVSCCCARSVWFSLCLTLPFTVWTDEAWIAENGTAAVGEFAVGTEGGASGMV